MSGSSSDHIVIGQFAGPHGVRGQFKVRSYTADPASVASYGPVLAGGRQLTLSLVREVKPGLFVAEAAEVATREDAESFKGTVLTVSRSVLPPAEEDEFYLTDLVGLTALDADGAPAGRVKAVVNYGAGDVVELVDVPDRKGTILVPFDRHHVPDINLTAGSLTVSFPEGDDDPDDAQKD